MNIGSLATTLLVTLVAVLLQLSITISYNPSFNLRWLPPLKNLLLRSKPQLYTSKIPCVSFPAVNTVGEDTVGLKGTNGNDACTFGSQVYGRAGWYKNQWAIMYTWYFPKSFWLSSPWRRHDWKSIVVWIDYPDLETPKTVGVSKSKSVSKCTTKNSKCGQGFQNESIRLSVSGLVEMDGDYHDLIMWEQFSDAVREALNDGNDFGDAEVSFSVEHYEDHLESAFKIPISDVFGLANGYDKFLQVPNCTYT